MSTDKQMDAATAFQIVIDMAKESVLAGATYDRQMTAIAIVEDVAVNQYGDEEEEDDTKERHGFVVAEY